MEYSKDKWQRGPWNNEPDRLEWKDPETGYPCLLNRNMFGVLCGYVAITDPKHPWFGTTYQDIEDIGVHGGLTYSNKCSGHICHVPAPGEPDDVWWLGFDCGHWSDLAPAVNYTHGGTYRDIAYVQKECAALARQIKEKSYETNIGVNP